MNHLSASEWEVLSALFDEADELDEVALADWLENHRANAHPLLPHLERMLDARTQVKAGAFIERPAGASLHQSPLGGDWTAGQRVGAYTLMRQLGRGGMAEVWLAERSDGAFERNVAIKLLYGDASSRRRTSFVQRFDRERDILASLNHPNIARLLDAGVTTTCQPWIALEYVQGAHLTDYCDTHRLSVRARVELFLQVLLAVQYAHANLVIHRDIKPPNILVTDKGQVQLLDFGIAKIIDSQEHSSTETELTQQAGRPLTLLYASPEQIRGEALTVASDVYSLGVVLYQLLCGDSPYELKRESAAFLEQAIQDVDPRAPSRRTLSEAVALARSSTREALRRVLLNDLDAIVLKALNKLPEQRYSGAEALLLDLRRWLEGQAVLAKPPSKTYYLRKFVYRHKLGVALGAAGVAALLFVSSIALVFGIQANRQSERAKASRDFMIEMFRQADPEKYAGREITAKELVSVAKSTLIRQLGDQPLLQAELLHGLGVAQYNMAQYLQAEQTMAESSRILQRIERPKELAAALVDQAFTVYSIGDMARVRALLDDVAKVMANERLEPFTQGRFHEMAALLSLTLQDPQAAEDHAAQAARLIHRAVGDQHPEALRAQVLLGRIQMGFGRYEAAAQSLQVAQQQLERFPEMEIGKVVYLEGSLARLEALTGTYARAERLYEAVATKCETSLGRMAEDCVILRTFQTRLVLTMGDHQQAMRLLPTLLAQVRATNAPRRQAETLPTVASVIYRNQLRDSHTDVWSQLVNLSEAGTESKLPESLKVQALLVRAEELLSKGQTSQALGLLARARTRMEEAKLPMETYFAQADVLQGVADAMAGRLDSAANSMGEALTKLDRLKAPAAALQLVRLNLAVVQAAAGKTAQAREQLTSSTDILRANFGAKSPVVQRAESKLSTLIGGSGTGPLALSDFFL